MYKPDIFSRNFTTGSMKETWRVAQSLLNIEFASSATCSSCYTPINISPALCYYAKTSGVRAERQERFRGKQEQSIFRGGSTILPIRFCRHFDKLVRCFGVRGTDQRSFRLLRTICSVTVRRKNCNVRVMADNRKRSAFSRPVFLRKQFDLTQHVVPGISPLLITDN